MEAQESNAVLQSQRERLCVTLLGVVFVVLTFWSWRKWTDVQVDFGLQLYTPWQLAEGKVLYRDISYIAGGPLSQYFNALLFKIFGASYLVIVLANLVIAWLVTWAMFRLFARAAGWATAALISLVMLGGFVFGHLTDVGNYNFITPYTSETVHGFALAVLVIVGLGRWLMTNKKQWLGGAGMALGGVFLTKPEMFVAVAAVVALAAVMREIILPDAWSVRGRNLLVFGGGGLVPVVVFALYFVSVWPTRAGVLAVAGAWLPLLGGKAGHGQYYDWCLGLDTPGANLVQMLQYTAAAVVIVAVLALGGRFIQRRKFLAAGLIWCALAGFLFSPLNKLEWVQGGRALPPLALAGAALLGWKWWQVRRGRPGEELIFPLMWAAFALLLLAKMGLNARIWHYGFYLALPATALVLLVLFRWLPPLLELFDVDVKWFRTALAVFFMVGVVKLLVLSNHYYALKTLPVGAGSDRIMAYPKEVHPAGQCVAEAVKWLQGHTSSRDTLAVLPEGTMVSYLARRVNPSPYVVVCPHEVQVAGEGAVTGAFAARPPQWVLLMHRRTAEFGVGYFGAADGYGQDFMRLVKANYTSVWLLGDEPLTTDRFGMKLLKNSRLASAPVR